MPATYKISNHDTFKVIDENKVGMMVTLTACDARTKTFYHEVESTDPAVINEILNKLAWDFDQNADAQTPNPQLVFNQDIPVTDPNA